MRYTEKEKKKAVKYAMDNTYSAAAKKWDVAKSTIYRWKKKHGKEAVQERNKETKQGGPTNRYKDEWQHRLEEVKDWAKAGLTNEQIANNMGINERTFYRWQNKYEGFREAVMSGKRAADIKVENALYRNAIGFRYDEEVLTNQGDVMQVERYSKPNTSAQKFWLQNRQPERWKDKKEVNANVEMNPVEAIIKADEELSGSDGETE